MRCEYCGARSDNEDEFIKINYIDYIMQYENPIISDVVMDIEREYTLCRYSWCQRWVFGRVTEKEIEYPAEINKKLAEERNNKTK